MTRDRIIASLHDDTFLGKVGFSFFLHLIIIIGFYLGLPVLYKSITPIIPPPAYDIVMVADITNLAPSQASAPSIAPPAPPMPKMTEQTDDLAPPMPKKKPIKPEDKTTPNSLGSVLRDVAKLKNKPSPNALEKTKSDAPAKATGAGNPSLPLSVSEEDALRRQIEGCWNMPIGAKDAHDLVVEVHILVNPDRSVQSAEVIDKMRMASDPYYRAAGESALRALHNPRCNPLHLPEGKYETWKEIEFNFDPKDML